MMYWGFAAEKRPQTHKIIIKNEEKTFPALGLLPSAMLYIL